MFSICLRFVCVCLSYHHSIVCGCVDAKCLKWSIWYASFGTDNFTTSSRKQAINCAKCYTSFMDFKPFHNSSQKRRLLVKSWKVWKNLYWDYDRWNWTYNTISGQIDGIHRFKGHAICVQAQTFNEELLRFEIHLKHIRNINRSKFHHFNMLLKFPHYEKSFGWNHLIFGSFGKIFSWQEHQSHQSTCITCTLNSSAIVYIILHSSISIAYVRRYFNAFTVSL